MLFQWSIAPVSLPAAVDSYDVLFPPQLCSSTIVGKFPLPAAGSVTSASSRTPSNDGTRCAEPSFGQKRTPSCGTQVKPSGAGSAADAAAGSASSAASKATRTLPPTKGKLPGQRILNSTFASTPTSVWLL